MFKLLDFMYFRIHNNLNQRPKMAHQLTEGALLRMRQGEKVAGPVLQVLSQDGWVTFFLLFGSIYNVYILRSLRDKLHLSDGKFSLKFMFCNINLNLAPFTIIKTKIKICGFGLWINDLEILTSGDQVGVQLGNPTKIGAGGKIIDPLHVKLSALR